MASIHVNPTRMELKKLKARLLTARRGHKLLKDKRDELMRRFLLLVRENEQQRRETEAALRRAYTGFALAAAVTDPSALRAALLSPQSADGVAVGTQHLLSVEVPTFSLPAGAAAEEGAPFGFAFTSGELDAAIDEMRALRADLLRLAENEKAVFLLSDEIERTRRRVNALEHIMIPQYEAAIREISMKLDENERGERTRLMKVKDLMLAKAHPAAQE